ncbi:hypothetical protein HDV00_001043, partial [Rhizophlyctis rosea]
MPEVALPGERHHLFSDLFAHGHSESFANTGSSNGYRIMIGKTGVRREDLPGLQE